MSLLSSSLYLALGAGAAAVTGMLVTPAQSPATAPLEPVPLAEGARSPANLVITSPRICAAMAVYQLAKHDDWGLRATIASTALNGFHDAGVVPDCATGVAQVLTQEFTPRRWQEALDAVDAVATGDYSISPDACARANTIIPLSIVPDSPLDAATPLAAARAQCVFYDLAFIEVRV